MAAITHENSDLMANILATPPVRNERWKSRAYVYRDYFSAVRAAAGGAGSYFRLAKLPAGAMLVLGDSKVMHSDWDGTVTAVFGWEEYIGPDGTVYAANTDGLLTGLDVSGQASTAGIYLSTGTIVADYKIFEGPAVIVAEVAGGDVPLAATLQGWLTYAMPH